ncbi:MAG: hypothetical protein R3264_04695, partial [Anaerolineae bacterium]|nr:hypothetical protein [Anaerolineae bacterium]
MDYRITSTSSLPPFQEHPQYKEGITHLKAGQWRKASQSFLALQKLYPSEAEVQKLLEDTQMRSTVAQVMPVSSLTPQDKIRRLAIGALLILVVVVGGYIAYELWIDPFIIQEWRLGQVTALRTEADEAMVKG